MNEITLLFFIQLRASLMKEAHDLAELRAAKLQMAETIKRLLDAETEKEKLQELEKIS